MAWLVFDLHGSVAGLCPVGTSTITDAYRYDGFGGQVASSGSAVNPFRYRGLLNIGADTLTGALLGMGARDYSPQLGAFTPWAPLGNRYTLIPDTCQQNAGSFSGTCVDEEAVGNILTFYVLAGGVILACAAVCVPLLCGGSAATATLAATGSASEAATTFVVVAGADTVAETIGITCAFAGACFGPEVGAPARIREPLGRTPGYDQMPLFVDTPQGIAMQATTAEALACQWPRDSVLHGGTVYKGGGIRSYPPEESRFFSLYTQTHLDTPISMGCPTGTCLSLGWLEAVFERVKPS